MIRKITVDHVAFVTDRAFDAVVKTFEEQVGSLEATGPCVPNVEAGGST